MATVLAAAAALLIPIAIAPTSGAPFWSARGALLVALGAAGLTTMPQILRRPDLRRVAAAACVYLALAGLSTVACDEPWTAIVGLYGWGSGLLFFIACGGLWCLGLAVPPDERRLVVAALLMGLGLSAVMALLQALDLVRQPLLEAGGRVHAFTGNAGRFAVLAVGATAMGALAARQSWRWAFVTLIGSTAAQLSGTRSALAAVVVLALVAAVRQRGMVRLLAPTFVVAGLALGSAIGAVEDVSTASVRSGDVGSIEEFQSSTLRVRLHVWSFAREAFMRAPIIGDGPGRFRAATSQDTPVEVARIEGSSVLYVDAHNVIVEHLITTGVLGAAAFITWLALALVRARGPLAHFGLAALAMSMVQPLNVSWTPLIFLALGVGGSLSGIRLPRMGLMTIVPIGVGLGCVLLLGDLALGDAIRTGDVRPAERAERLLRPYPEPAMMMANVLDMRAGVSTDAVIDWREEALRRDRTSPRMALLLAEQERRAGRFDAAERHYRLTLRHHPWSVFTMTRLAELEMRTCEIDEARALVERARAVGERSVDVLARSVDLAADRCEGRSD